MNKRSLALFLLLLPVTCFAASYLQQDSGALHRAFFFVFMILLINGGAMVLPYRSKSIFTLIVLFAAIAIAAIGLLSAVNRIPIAMMQYGTPTSDSRYLTGLQAHMTTDRKKIAWIIFLQVIQCVICFLLIRHYVGWCVKIIRTRRERRSLE